MPDRYVATPHDQVADEEIVIYHIRQRESFAPKDRLTLRMEARRLIDALDAGREMREQLRTVGARRELTPRGRSDA